MNKREIIDRIEVNLRTCRTCDSRMELTRIHGCNFSKIDGPCKACPTAITLRDLGKQLETGRKIKIPTWWDREQDIMADTPIIPGEAG